MSPADPLAPPLQLLGIAPEEVRACLNLPGEVDRNFRIDLQNGRSFLLKESSPDGFRQEPILRYLADRELPFSVPLHLRSVNADLAGRSHVFSLHTWVPGTPLGEWLARPDDLFTDWGRVTGLLHQALNGLDYPAAYRSYKWEPAGAGRYAHLLPYLHDEHLARSVRSVLGRLSQLDTSRLPRSLCYHDAHEQNLLVDHTGRITGVIDFGDAMHTLSVSEVAVACAYAGMDMPDPLDAMRLLVGAYHRASTLSPAELDALYVLIGARLCLTVLFAAENRALHPDNAYLTVSDQPARALLQRWAAYPAALVSAAFRSACGYAAHPAAEPFQAWVKRSSPHPVVRRAGTLLPIDLGVGSRQLGNSATYLEPRRFVRHLRRTLEDAEAGLGYGGYGEVRPVYATDDFAGTGNSGPRWRSVHLGLDLWTPEAGVDVFAPVAGTVYASGVDPTAGGYGGTLILRHQPENGPVFFTLYGHLAPDSVADWGDGAQVPAGHPIGKLGGPEENGGWPPHLHFQVLLDPLGMGVDFPGVAYPEQRDYWLGLCPDPALLFPLPAEPERNECSPELLADRRARTLGYGLSLSYDQPLQILRGHRQYLIDHTGRRFLDTVNNVAHVGHEHPAVVEAGQRQMAVLNTNTRYLHPLVLDLAEQLTALLPAPLSVVHFVNSGSEANELALRMAEVVTGSPDTLALPMGYHGNTKRTIEVSEYKFSRPGGQGKPARTHLLPLVDHATDVPAGRWNFIHETILSCAGQVPLPEGFLPRTYARVRAAGGICIADEVQTGLGRVGTHWWAFEVHGVIPDIVTVGKPFGNGHPLAAVVCTPEVARAFHNGMEYFNTFGGNPVSAAIGLSVLETLRAEALRERALTNGRYLASKLSDLGAHHGLITDVRGAGLFLGVELTDGSGLPASRQAGYVKNRMRDLGFLLSTDGPNDNVLKFKPPLCISEEDIDRLCDYLHRTLREDAARP